MISNMFFRLYMDLMNFLGKHWSKYSFINYFVLWLYKNRIKSSLTYAINSAKNNNEVISLLISYLEFTIYFNRERGYSLNCEKVLFEKSQLSWTEDPTEHRLKSFTYAIFNPGSNIYISSTSSPLTDKVDVKIDIGKYTEGKGVGFVLYSQMCNMGNLTIWNSVVDIVTSHIYHELYNDYMKAVDIFNNVDGVIFDDT